MMLDQIVAGASHTCQEMQLLATVVCVAWLEAVSVHVLPVSGLCSQIDTSWIVYTARPAPKEFEGESTLGSCSRSTRSDLATCLRPARLADGSHGSPTLNASAVQAWSQDTSSTVTISIASSGSSRNVTGINLYFYHIPSRGIGLPNDIRITRSDVTDQALIEGNQDLSQDNNHLRNVTLVPQSLPNSGSTVSIEFIFASFRDRVKSLLLTEVEICTSSEALALLVPPPITFTEDTVSSVSPSTINSSITLTCSVTEGRFDWKWQGPPGISWPRPLVINAGRTSVQELSNLTSAHSGTYRCVATHRYGQDPLLSADFNITLSLMEGAIQEERSVVNINASDSTATLRCMLYGYLPSGQEPSILWGLNGAMLRSSNVYTITTEDGDRLIQNGGPQPIPSLTSTLTINLTLFPVIGSLAYTCFSSQASSPAFKTITVMSDTTTADNPIGASPSSPPLLSNDYVVILLGVLPPVAVLIIILVTIITIVMCVKRKRRRKRLSGHGSKNPMYEEVFIPKPPPIPSQFPSLSASDIKPYASAVNGTGVRTHSDVSHRYKPAEFRMSQNKVYELQDRESCYYEDPDLMIAQHQESLFIVAKIQQEQEQVLQGEDAPQSPLHENENLVYGFNQANESTAVQDLGCNTTVHQEEVDSVCEDSILAANQPSQDQDMDYVMMASAPAQQPLPNKNLTMLP